MSRIHSVLIFLFTYFLIIILSFKGGSNMQIDSGVATLAVAIIGVATTLLGNLIVNIFGWRSCKNRIGRSSSDKNLISMIGTDGSDEISLSAQHKKISLDIKEKNIALSKEVNDVKSIVGEMDRQIREEKARREERDMLLSAKQFNAVQAVEDLQVFARLYKEQTFELNNACETILKRDKEIKLLEERAQILENKCNEYEDTIRSLTNQLYEYEQDDSQEYHI